MISTTGLRIRLSVCLGEQLLGSLGTLRVLMTEVKGGVERGVWGEQL